MNRDVATGIARAAALAQGLQTSPLTGPSYLPRSSDDAQQFVPHEWVVNAILQAANITPAGSFLQIAAQAWCEPETSTVEMDSRLAVAFARILQKSIAGGVFHPLPTPFSEDFDPTQFFPKTDSIEEQRAFTANWVRSAAMFSHNSDFYQGLVTKIGLNFGLAAKTDDEGQVGTSVLALKVPELVLQLIAEHAKLKTALALARDAWGQPEFPSALVEDALNTSAPVEATQALLEVGKDMVDITTTVRGVEEWPAIQGLWMKCLEERDQLKAVVLQNHQWHKDHDDHDGYAESELCTANQLVLGPKLSQV